MNLAAAAPSWLIVVLVVLLLLAAAEDSWRMRISNLIVLAVLAGAVAAATLAGPTLALWQNLVMFAGLLVIGTAMFAAGRLGGGDVKLLAASGAWFSLQGGMLMILWTLVAGGVLALTILLVRSLNWSDTTRARVAVLKRGAGIPYGVAIAAGSLIGIGLG
jgi:prepilin peptidase CpaA